MEKYVDSMKQIIELAETCLEGIGLIKTKLNDGYLKDTIVLLHGVVNAFSQMEKSISYVAHLAPNQLEQSTARVRNALDHVVAAYEKVQAGKALEIIQFNLLPSYKQWKSELEQSLSSYR